MELRGKLSRCDRLATFVHRLGDHQVVGEVDSHAVTFAAEDALRQA